MKGYNSNYPKNANKKKSEHSVILYSVKTIEINHLL
jgi:hypothetical protein